MWEMPRDVVLRIVRIVYTSLTIDERLSSGWRPGHLRPAAKLTRALGQRVRRQADVIAGGSADLLEPDADPDDDCATIIHTVKVEEHRPMLFGRTYSCGFFGVELQTGREVCCFGRIERRVPRRLNC